MDVFEGRLGEGTAALGRKDTLALTRRQQIFAMWKWFDPLCDWK